MIYLYIYLFIGLFFYIGACIYGWKNFDKSSAWLVIQGFFFGVFLWWAVAIVLWKQRKDNTL